MAKLLDFAQLGGLAAIGDLEDAVDGGLGAIGLQVRYGAFNGLLCGTFFTHLDHPRYGIVASVQYE